MLPPQVSLVAPTGTTPRARAWSWSLQPRVATRFGSFSMVVSPKACSIVTGKASASALVLALADLLSESVEPVEQPVRARAPTAAAIARWRREDAGGSWVSFGSRAVVRQA